MAFDLTALGRKLKFPLYYTLAPSDKTDDETLPSPQIEWTTEDSNERVNVVLNLSLNEFIAIASAIDVGRDVAYGEDSETVWWIWNRAFAIGSESPIEPVAPTFAFGGATQIGTFFAEVIEEVKETELINHQVVFRGGKAYIVVPCGCDDAKFYPLPDAVFLNGNGDPIAVGDGGEFGGAFDAGSSNPNWNGTVSSVNQSCYQSAATTYLLQRAKDFWYAVIDYGIIGSGIKTPTLSEYINFPELLGAIASGIQNIDYIRSIGKAGVDVVLGDSAFVTSMANAWTFDGSVNRDQLRDWIYEGSPTSVGGFSASVMMNTWVDFSLLFNMNEDLQDIAISCEFPDSQLDFEFEWAYLFNFIVDEQGWNPGGTTDGVYVAGFGWTHGAGAEDDRIEIIYPDDALEITGIYVKCDRAMVGNAQRLRLNQGEDNTGTQTDETGLDTEEFSLPVTGTYPSGIWLLMNENNLPAAQFDLHIEQIILYGNGTTPTTGTPLI